MSKETESLIFAIATVAFYLFVAGMIFASYWESRKRAQRHEVEWKKRMEAESEIAGKIRDKMVANAEEVHQAQLAALRNVGPRKQPWED